MAGELNPEFSFDIGTDEQVPWELTGALLEADPTRSGKQSSIDFKIQQRLLAKGKQRKDASRVRRNTKAHKRGVAAREEAEDYDSSSEDEPLPEELEGQGSEHSSETPLEADSESESGEQVAGGDSRDEDSGSDGGIESEQEVVGLQEAAAERRASGKTAGPSAAAYFAELPEGTSFSAPSFGDLNLSRPLVKACTLLGYKQPTPIQAACIPLALMGRDISGSAVTGSGKTAAFGLPILERLLFRSRKSAAAIYALVLTPTRELAVQVHSMLQKLSQFTDIRVALVVGGLSLQVQAATLRSDPEIIVATPGRLIDHLRNTQSVGIENLQALVIDEADRLLEMGFAEEIKEVLRLTPRKRQTMLFSATMTEEVKALASLSLQRPVRLAADPKATAPQQLRQEVVRVKGRDKMSKEAILLALCSRGFQKGRTIVFFRTKKQAHRAKMLFGLGGLPSAAELHGDMTQTMRLESLERFRKGEVAFLLATDVAARGLDILGVETVVNFDIPSSLASYLHRIGRTARAGQSGRSITFVEEEDRKLMKEVVKQSVKLHERIIPGTAVESWAAKIERLAPDIARLVQEEREERQLRKAEMEVAKAENMIQHEAEIYSRPARTWFQTASQKAAAAKSEVEGLGLPERDATAKGGKKKRSQEQEADGRKLKRVRGGKSDQKAVGGAEEVQHSEDRLTEKKPAKKTDKTSAKKKRAGKDNDKGLFEGQGRETPEKAGPPPRVYPGGRKSGKFRAPGGKTKQERNKLRRGGRGSKSFKSRAKHNRRK